MGRPPGGGKRPLPGLPPVVALGPGPLSGYRSKSSSTRSVTARDWQART